MCSKGSTRNRDDDQVDGNLNAYDTQICVWAELPTKICVSYAFHDMCLTRTMKKVLLNSTIIKIERSFVNSDVVGQPNKVTNMLD